MKIAVMGTGGIGGFYGGMLARAGHDVTFIARGDNLKAIQERGLTIERDRERFTVSPARATDDPRSVGTVRLVLLATKAYDLERAVPAMAPLVGPDTAVLPLLNGVDIPERIARHLKAGRVLAGLTYVPANRPRPGVVQQPGPERKMVFGETDGAPGPSTREILELLRSAGLRAELTADIHKALWSKFMLVNANGGVCGVTRSPIGAVMGTPEIRALYEACCREVDAVARARGVALDADAVAKTLAHAASTPPDNKPSMLQDLEAGNPLELEVLNGTLARLGRESGVPVPVNTMIYAALKSRAGGAPAAEGTMR